MRDSKGRALQIGDEVVVRMRVASFDGNQGWVGLEQVLPEGEWRNAPNMYVDPSTVDRLDFSCTVEYRPTPRVV